MVIAVDALEMGQSSDITGQVRRSGELHSCHCMHHIETPIGKATSTVPMCGQVMVTQRAACRSQGSGHAACSGTGTTRLLSYKLQDNGVRFTECHASVNGHHTR